MTQCEIILDLLKKGPLSQKTAFERFKIYQLAARIKDLRSEGYEINTKLIRTENQYGELVHYAEYHFN